MKLSPDPPITSEQEVLLWVIRVDHKNDQRVAEILSSGVEWGYIRETAIRHGIIPLLYKRLKAEMADLVPVNELSTLRTLFLANAVKNIRMTHNLLNVIDILADSGVDAMPFKGPALAVQAYGDISLRSFGDLDILFHANDRSKVYQIMMDQGFLTDQGDILNDPVRRSLEKDLSFYFHDDLLELHWKIIEELYAVSLDMDQIWDRSVPIYIDGHKIKTLSPEDMVIVLCFHGHKHAWQNLKWLADLIYTISNHPDIKWHNLFVRAENMGLKRIVLIGMLLAHKHGGIRYGFEIENQLVLDTTILKLTSIIQLNLFRFQTWELSFNNALFYLNSRERFKDKIMFLLYFFSYRVLLFSGRILRQISSKRTSRNKGVG